MTSQSSEGPAPSAATSQTSGLAMVSLIFGIATWIILPVIGAIVAIITGHIARRDIAAGMGRLTGSGMATAGLILGYGQVVILAVSICLIVLLALMGPAIGTVFSNIVMDI